jgi:hypothetical protein
MIFRKVNLSAARTLLWAGVLAVQIEKVTVEDRIEALSNPAVVFRAETQAMAQPESVKKMAPPDGPVWQNAYPDTGMTVSLEQMEAEKKDLERLAHGLEGTDRVLEDSERQERESLEEKARAAAGIKADAELAAAAIEQATVELENEASEQHRKAEQETAALKDKFTAERDKMVGNLDQMRDKYFVKYPNLDPGQRTDAEGTFKTIKDDAVKALKVDQGTRLAELEARHQGLQENHEQRRKELEGTRARDDDRA